MTAVIFDMDGVIFDSERAYIECMEEVAKKHGLEGMREVAYKCIGTTSAATREIVLEAYGSDIEYDSFVSEASGIFHGKYDGGRLPIKRGAREILSALKDMGVPVALASSTREETVRKELTEAGLIDFFDHLVCGDMVKKSKPEPDIFLKACEMLGTEPQNAYVIEDSFNGIRAAYSAGTHPIMVPDILGPDDEMRTKAEKIFDSLFAARDFLVANKNAL